MKLTHALAGGLCIAIAAQALAQTTAAPAPTLAAPMKMTVYPAKGQDATVQSKDEAECYNWSKQQTGYDPSTHRRLPWLRRWKPHRLNPPARARGAQCAGPPRARWSEKSRTTMRTRVRIPAPRSAWSPAVRAIARRSAQQEAQVDAANSAGAGRGRSAQRRECAGAGEFQEGHGRLPGRQGLRGQVAQLAVAVGLAPSRFCARSSVSLYAM